MSSTFEAKTYRVLHAAIIYQVLHNSDPFLSSQVAIFGALLLPEANVGETLKLLMSQSFHQAALLHKFLHESVNFMIDFVLVPIENPGRFFIIILVY